MPPRLCEPHYKFSSGKYEGKTIADVYTGNAGLMVSAYLKFIQQALEALFSTDLYYALDSSIISEIQNKAFESSTENSIFKLIRALLNTASHSIYIEQNIIKIKVYQTGCSEPDQGLSQIAREVAKAYIANPNMTTGILSKFNNLPWSRKPSVLIIKKLNSLVDTYKCACGSPAYIYSCIEKLDWFCMAGSEEELANIDNLPTFSARSMRMKFGQADDEFSFYVQFAFNPSFKKIEERLAKINYDKWLSYYQQKPLEYAEEDLYEGDDDYYDSDDDEGNIMRGLASGNGDQFGY